MITTTPLSSTVSTLSASDETEPREPGDGRSPRGPSVRAVDASASRPPVEVLIEEARHRARRRRQVVGAVAVVAVAVAAIALTAALDGAGSTGDRGTAVGGPMSETSLGVFGPMRGRIVWAADGELRAVDPADPTDIRRMALPEDLDSTAMVSGWSADGTRLALTSEHAGKFYVVDASGGVTSETENQPCCLFVSEPWLAPDGSTVAEFGPDGRLELRDFDGATVAREFEVDPALADAFIAPGPVGAWSPDGTRLAFIVYEYDETDGTEVPPSIFIVDARTGTTGRLIGPIFDHIRHLTWSPDAQTLLITAGTSRARVAADGNPANAASNTDLYLIDTEIDSWHPFPWPERIASGHFVAATWSPRGELIAAIDRAPTGRSLVVMRRDGSDQRRLAGGIGTGAFIGLAWHPVPSERQ